MGFSKGLVAQRRRHWLWKRFNRRRTAGASDLLEVYSPTNGVGVSFEENWIDIRDPVTTANNYSGPLINPATGLFNKLTFSRPDATTCATYKDASGVIRLAAANVPRISYESYGRVLLMEGSRTNLATESEFRNGVSDAPTRGGLITGTAFAGLTAGTGLAFGFDGATVTFGYKPLTVAAGAAAVSAFIRMDDGAAPTFGNPTGSDPANTFAFVAESNVIDPTTYKVETLAPGLYRVKAVLTATNIAGNYGIVKYNTNNNRTFKTSGYQVEVGSWPSSYIPTTTVAVTRAAETCSLANTLFNLTNTQGTLYVKANSGDVPNSDVTVRMVAAISDGAAYTNAIRLERLSGIDREIKTVGGAALVNSAGVWSPNVTKKLAASYDSGGGASSVDGAVATAFAGTNPTGMTALSIGCGPAGGNNWESGISEFAFFGSRISNANLQALAT